MTRTIGFEAEYTGGDPLLVTDLLISRGLWNVEPNGRCDCGDDFGQHYNHCTCSGCEWGGSAFRHHSDPTVDGEIVSDPMPWPTQRTARRIRQLARVMSAADCRATSHAGFHIHVALDDAIDDAVLFDYFALYEDEISHYARQALGRVRSYNHRVKNENDPAMRRPDSPWYHRVVEKMAHSPGHGWNLARRSRTWEFRIWNSTTSAWRMMMACSITVAFLDAVANAPADVREHTYDGTLATFIAPYLSTEALGYMLRHLYLAEA